MDYDQTAKDMAISAGFLGANRTEFTYKGFIVFDPVEKQNGEGEDQPAIGMPMFILAKGDTVRWTQDLEGLDILDLFIERDGPDEDEIDEPSELDQELAAIEEQEELMKELDTDTDE